MINIVTAFYDIGRSNWNAFSRSTETYFEAFERLCHLQNNIVLFTSLEFKPRIDSIQQNIKKDLKVYYLDIFSENAMLLEKIKQIQESEEFQKGITNPSCPEYREPKYILINYLKSYFCTEAYKRDTTLTGKAAWIDFGYCRKNRHLPPSRKWDYDFNEKIQLFNLLNIHDNINIIDTIKTNTVYIQGCHIVADIDGWNRLSGFMRESLDDLLSKNLVDDDQTLLLLCYLKSKHDFCLHEAKITKKYNWFFIFRLFNHLDRVPNKFLNFILQLFR